MAFLEGQLSLIPEDSDNDLYINKEITLDNHDGEDKVETEIGHNDFVNIISLIVEDGEGDIDDGEHEKTVVEVEDFLKIEPRLPSFLN